MEVFVCFVLTRWQDRKRPGEESGVQSLYHMCYPWAMFIPLPLPSRFRRLLNRAWVMFACPSPQEKMLQAIATNDLDMAVDILVAGGLDLNGSLPPVSPFDDHPRPQTGITLLHEAAGRGSFEMVELLLGHGSRASAKTSWNISPMHRAAIVGRAHVVALLQSHGASPLDLFPCLSRYIEDDPYTPNSIELLENNAGVVYVGDEHARYRAQRDGDCLEVATPPSSTPAAPRPRL